MRFSRERLARGLLVALCLSAPAFAYTSSDVNDSSNTGIDNPGLDVTRHAMPLPDVTAKPAAAPTVSANPLWAIPLSALAATRNHPLFTPSRRPPAPVVASIPVVTQGPPPPLPSAPEHPNLVLVGTVAGENEGLAVFVDSATRDTVRLRIGEGHSGWILQSVERKSATLQKGQRSETLELPRPNAPQNAAPIVTALPPPAPLPPQVGAPAPAKGPTSGGCMPEPVGC
jgi:hypothetical protein